MVILLLTMISPPFVSSLSYIMLFGKRGLITHSLLHLTWNPYGWWGIIMMQVLSNTSLASLILIGSFINIDNNTINASLDLGASKNHTLFKIIFPLGLPGIISAGLITFVKCLSDFGTPIIIGGNFEVLATEAYLNIIGRGNFPKASAMSVLIFIPALLAFAAYKYFMKNTNSISSFINKGKDEEGYILDNNIKNIVIIVTGFFLLIMVLQYVSIFMSSFSIYKGKHIEFTLKYIQSFIKYNKLDSFLRSIKYGLIVGIIGSFLGIILSYIIERKEIRYGGLIDFIITLPYIIPGSFFGIGYILAFNHYPVYITGTSAIVVINCIYRQLPISTRAGSSIVNNINIDIENAASDLGASRLHILKDIILPLLKPAFLIGFINNFTATMTTVGAIIFIISPRAKVATVEMFNAIRDGDYGVGAVFASLIIICTLIINLSFSKIILNKRED
ncbi:MAG: iron ABC transporter permease [Maledivibacter sp.]|nr:iron ABC transporter permease [Maledivibacter sp.]